MQGQAKWKQKGFL